MKKDILVSIIIVTYNVEDSIEACIKSVLKSTNKNFELIIIDGASNDKSVTIIKKYLEKINFFISEKDNGIYDAMIKGIKVANGKFILFLGADDKLIVDTNSLTNILIDEKTIYYGNVILDPSNKKYDEKFTLEKLINRNICHQSIFYPKKVFNEYKFNSRYKYMADYVMNMELWSSKIYKFEYINKTISIYSTKGSSSTIIDSNFKKDSFKLVFKNFGVYGILIKLTNKLRNLIDKSSI